MTESLRFQIEREAAGQRLDEFLAERVGQLSRLRIARLLAEGACTVNASVARAGQQLKSGDMVELFPGESTPGAMTPEPLPLEIVYEDEHLLVVVKPAGMLVHPTRGVKTGTLANALTYHLNRLRISDCGMRIEETGELSSNQHSAFRLPQLVRPGIVHRLDYATSGLMVIAKHQRALSILSRHFHERRVEKRYLALVRGRVLEDERHIIAPIGRDPEARPHWRVKEDGKQAETRLRVLERKADLTLVELEPVTGRTNQLRIHCAYLNHPIIGDSLHGIESAPGRLCLHAARLAFHHPVGGKWMEFVSALPFEIMAVLRAEPAI